MLEDLSTMRDPSVNAILAAERLAAQYVPRSTPILPGPPFIRESSHPGLLEFVFPSKSAVLLLHESTLEAKLLRIVPPGKGYKLEVLSRGFLPLPDILELPVRSRWLLFRESAVVFPEPLLETNGIGRSMTYAWVSILVLVATSCLALVLGYFVFRQLRLAGLKNELISVIAHELKTPLASMRLLVDTLREGRAGAPEQQTEYLDLIARENLRLSHLVENFLTFSRLEQGRTLFVNEAVDVAKLLQDAVALVAQRFAGEHQQVTLDLPEVLPALQGDRDALLTALLNLLDNAWKFTGEEKHVRVTACVEGGYLRIDVTDNGIGLGPGAAARVFDRFYQEDRRLTHHAGGCGLGLSIVRFIVEAHCGKASAEGRKGTGSTFTMHLPVPEESQA